MIEIDDLSLNEWYACLKPYQKVVIEQLVSKYGEEKAAEEWLTARGPIQTATFGGSQTNTAEAQNYWSRLKDEFDKLICGHPDYEKEQKKFLAAGKIHRFRKCYCSIKLVITNYRNDTCHFSSCHYPNITHYIQNGS